MGQTLIALGTVLCVIFLLRLLLRAGGLDRRRPVRGRLRVLDTCALGARQRVHLVEIEGERLLLGATDGSVTLLRQLPARPPGAGAEEAGGPEAAPERGRALAALRAGLRRAGASAGIALALLLLVPSLAGATDPAGAAAAFPIDLGSATQPERISGTLEIVALITLLSVAPSILLMATCFTRVVIVLALLRQAIGIHQLPPNQILVGLALAITFFVMAPLGGQIQKQALDPYVAEEIEAPVAADRALGAVRGFLLRYTRTADLDLFVTMSGREPPGGPEDVSMVVLLPAYMISELRTAFEIGFTIFLPFMVVDLVIASMLISMQMIVLPPMLISLPFKLMLFVLLDGWNLVVGSLVQGLL